MSSWTKEYTEEINEEISRDLTEAEQHIIDIINSSNGDVIDFPCSSGKVLEHMKDKNKYTGIDFRHSFIDIAKSIFSENEQTRPENIRFKFFETFEDMVKAKVSANTVISIGYLNYENEPVEFIKKLIGNIPSENIYIVFEYAKEGGQKINERKYKSVGRGGSFVYNLFNQEAVEEIAKETGLNFNLFQGEEGKNNVALLFKVPEKKLETIVEVIEVETEEEEELTEEILKKQPEEEIKVSNKAKNKKSK